MLQSLLCLRKLGFQLGLFFDLVIQFRLQTRQCVCVLLLQCGFFLLQPCQFRTTRIVSVLALFAGHFSDSFLSLIRDKFDAFHDLSAALFLHWRSGFFSALLYVFVGFFFNI
jgi:hypothetical protein